MNISQLKDLIAVAEEKTFLDAADRQNISQSALSKQIARMEQELGCTLLDRSRRKAVLTPAGRIMYEEALRLSADYDRAMSRLDAFRKSAASRLSIGMLPFQAQYGLGSLLAGFAAAHPEISVHIEEKEEEELLDAYAAGRYDMIVCRATMIDPGESRTFPVCMDELVVAAADSHPLLKSRSISLEQVSRCPLMLMYPYTAIYQQCMKEFQDHHLKANIAGNGRIETILNYLPVGDAVSLLPRSNFRVFSHRGVSFRSLSPKIQLPVVLAHQKGRAMTPAMSALAEFLQKAG